MRREWRRVPVVVPVLRRPWLDAFAGAAWGPGAGAVGECGGAADPGEEGEGREELESDGGWLHGLGLVLLVLVCVAAVFATYGL